MLFVRSYVHEDLILYATRGIRRELTALAVLESAYALYEAYASHRYEIVRLARPAVFLDDVRHEPEVVTDEDVARFRVPLLARFQILSFFLFVERFGERSAVADVCGKTKDLA